MNDRRVSVCTLEPKQVGKGIGWQMHMHPQPLSFVEINAWSQVNRIRLEPWQIAALTLIDDVFMDHVNKPREPVMAAAARATPTHMHNMFAALMAPKAKKVEREVIKKKSKKGRR